MFTNAFTNGSSQCLNIIQIHYYMQVALKYVPFTIRFFKHRHATLNSDVMDEDIGFTAAFILKLRLLRKEKKIFGYQMLIVVN